MDHGLGKNLIEKVKLIKKIPKYLKVLENNNLMEDDWIIILTIRLQ